MESNTQSQLSKSIHLTEQLIKHLKLNGELCPLPNRDAFYHVFFNQNELDKFYVNLFPLEKLNVMGRTLSIISNASGSIGDSMLTSHMGDIDRISLIENLNEIYEVLVASLDQVNLNSSYSIFYSWESDLVSTTNRNFIESALHKAIKKINNDFEIAITLDKDTRGVSGSPDIISAILEKVERCFMFVGDVSITANYNGKSYPNSNVMFELGYAIKAIGDKKIIMVFNGSTGATNDLPFDLGLKRQMIFSCPDDISADDKKREKEKLVNNLYDAIKLGLEK